MVSISDTVMDLNHADLIRWVQEFRQRCSRKPTKEDIPEHLGGQYTNMFLMAFDAFHL